MVHQGKKERSRQDPIGMTEVGSKTQIGQKAETDLEDLHT